MSSELLETIYKASKKTVKAMSPVSFIYGTVTSIDPLKIRISDKIELGRASLILTDNVRDIKYSITQKEINTHSASVATHGSHIHLVLLPKEITIERRLKVGEKVILANNLGGNRFIVISRAEDRTRLDKIYDATQAM